MIREEAEPNTQSKLKAVTKPQAKVASTADKHHKELISPDRLKKLSKIYIISFLLMLTNANFHD